MLELLGLPLRQALSFLTQRTLDTWGGKLEPEETQQTVHFADKETDSETVDINLTREWVFCQSLPLSTYLKGLAFMAALEASDMEMGNHGNVILASGGLS